MHEIDNGCLRYKPLQAFIATEHGRCGYNVWKRECGVSSIESTMLVTVKDKFNSVRKSCVL